MFKSVKKCVPGAAEMSWQPKDEPVIVPRIIVPFLSSIVTVSLVNFIKNLFVRG
jgi:hypothetical protein